jgi:hypothetical protein
MTGSHWFPLVPGTSDPDWFPVPIPKGNRTRNYSRSRSTRTTGSRRRVSWVTTNLDAHLVEEQWPTTHDMPYVWGVGEGRRHRGAMPTGLVNVSLPELFQAATR